MIHWLVRFLPISTLLLAHSIVIHLMNKCSTITVSLKTVWNFHRLDLPTPTHPHTHTHTHTLTHTSHTHSHTHTHTHTHVRFEQTKMRLDIYCYEFLYLFQAWSHQLIVLFLSLISPSIDIGDQSTCSKSQRGSLAQSSCLLPPKGDIYTGTPPWSSRLYYPREWDRGCMTSVRSAHPGIWSCGL